MTSLDAITFSSKLGFFKLKLFSECFSERLVLVLECVLVHLDFDMGHIL